MIYRQSAINALENTECELLPEEWNELTNAIRQVPAYEKNTEYADGFIDGYKAGVKDGSGCPFNKRWGIECDDGYSACTIVQHLKEEVNE